MAYVYILQDRITGKYYTGSCLEPSKRVTRHQRHTGGRTTHQGIWELIRYKEIDLMTEARKLEKVVKSYKGGNAFKEIVLGKNKDWRDGRAG